MPRLLFLASIFLVSACDSDDKSESDTALATDTIETAGTGGATGATTGGTTTGGTTTGGTTTGGTSGTTTGSSTGTTSSTTVPTTVTTTTSSGTTITLPMGPNDAIAQAGCDLFLTGSTDSLVAVTSIFDAGQVLDRKSVV